VTTPANPVNPGNPPDPNAAHVEPAPGAPPEVVADEMLAHGLLTYLHKDTPEHQVRRVRHAMCTIAAESSQDPEAQAPGRRLRFPVRTARGWLALAASLALVATAAFFGFPGETSAQAVVQKSIDAMRTAGAGGAADRRFEVRMQRFADAELEKEPSAVVDMRPPNFLLLRAHAPEGHEIIAGRDQAGGWCIRLDGGVEREHPQQAWPRWAMVGDESLFADSVDRLLEEMARGYRLERSGEATLEGRPGTKFRHIVGTRNRPRGPGGDRVEIWIDPATNVVERLEMHWNQQTGGEGASPAGAQRGPNGGPGDDSMRRPHPPRGPRADPGAHDDGRPPRPEDGPDGDRLPPPRRGPPDGPRGDGPPPGGDPIGDRPPHDGPPGDGIGDRPFRDGPRPQGEPGAGPGGRGPGGPGGPGQAGRPGRRPPPRLLVIQRVDAPKFEPGWFSPEAHAGK